MRAYLLATTAFVAWLTATAHGQDATWQGVGPDFSDPRNWSPPVVPTGTAFFGPAAATSLFFFQTTNIGGFTFNAGAPDYSFTFDVPGRPNSLTFTGAGILNNSSDVPTFSLTENNALLSFRNSSTAANASINIDRRVAVPGTQPPTLMFNDTSTAGAATIVNTRGIIDFNGNSSAGTTTINSAILAQVNFNNFSSAGSATISNGVLGIGSSSVTFIDSSSAGSANITNNALWQFGNSSSAGSANITNNATLEFEHSSSAGSANITNNSALLFVSSSSAGSAIVHTTNGGLTQFNVSSSGGQARFITDAGGIFDLSSSTLSVPGVTVGSIEGAGTYLLGDKQLTTGANDLSTTVSGEITGTGGSLVKTGSGTLTLTGSNSYTSQTIVQNGTLAVDGSIAKSSLTTVHGGARLGGSGTVGSTIIASFGNLAPGPSETPGAMTVAGNLAFQTGALYIVQVNPTAASTTNITGTAALTGIVGANFAPDSYTRRSYTILSAAEGRTGTFALVLPSGLPVGFQASLSYTDNTVVLNLVPSQLGSAEGASFISTVGGSGTVCASSTAACGDGGPAFAAQFNSPRGLTLTPGGGYLIADRFDNRIRMVASVSPLATITPFAGTGTPCTPTTDPCGDGGPANAAQLTIPRATSLTASGGYLIADEGDHRIRQVSALSPSGIITTVAGTGVSGYSGDHGPATEAMLFLPHDVAALPNGDFLIADTYNHRVRLVAGGVITTVAGTGVQGYSGDGGPAVNAELSYPHGLAPLPGGGFLVADSSNNRVRQVSAAGIITTVAGNGIKCTDPTAPVNPCGDNGPATSAALALPRSIALLPDGGFVFSDLETNSVRQVSASGIITTIAGNGTAGFSGDGGLATAAELNGPQDVAVRADGSLLIADAAEGGPGSGNNRIRLVTGQSPAAVFSLNGPNFATGDTLSYQATLLPGAGQPPTVDVYLGVFLPDGHFASLVSPRPGLTEVMIADSPAPFATSLVLAQTAVPLSHTFTGAELAGTYFAYAALVPPGGRLDQSLSLDVAAFEFSP
jgi:autotransporter-associated beta strand protein